MCLFSLVRLLFTYDILKWKTPNVIKDETICRVCTGKTAIIITGLCALNELNIRIMLFMCVCIIVYLVKLIIKLLNYI